MSSKRIFSFSFENVNSREIALFTSYVRVLNYRLEHNWICRKKCAHLIVQGENFTQAESSWDQPGLAEVLVLSRNEKGEKFLNLPLDAKEIEEALNRIGNVLTRNNQEELNLSNSNQSYRLKSWPPTEMMKMAGYVRLSTLITKNAMSIHQLQQKSGFEFHECELFLENMLRNELIETLDFDEQRFARDAITVTNVERNSARSKVISLIRTSLARLSRK